MYMLDYRSDPSVCFILHDGPLQYIINFCLLQNGSVLVFDMRQTTGPMNSPRGLTSNPVHSLNSLLHNSTLPSGSRSVLSASSVGLCQWNFGGADEG